MSSISVGFQFNETPLCGDFPQSLHGLQDSLCALMFQHVQAYKDLTSQVHPKINVRIDVTFRQAESTGLASMLMDTELQIVGANGPSFTLSDLVRRLENEGLIISNPAYPVVRKTKQYEALLSFRGCAVGYESDGQRCSSFLVEVKRNPDQVRLLDGTTMGFDEAMANIDSSTRLDLHDFVGQEVYYTNRQKAKVTAVAKRVGSVNSKLKSPNHQWLELDNRDLLNYYAAMLALAESNAIKRNV